MKLVSAIIPVYNGKRYLRRALDSILAQTYSPIEIILIDDGSTDNSHEIAKQYPNVIYVAQENQGNALARMKGVDIAKGEWIAFLDQDDMWIPEKIALQMAAAREHPDCQCVVGKSHYFLDENSAPPPGIKQQILEEDKTSYLPSILMAQKSLFRKIPFSPLFTHGSDAEWFFRLKEANICIKILPTVLAHIRLHAENASHEAPKIYGDLLKIIQHSIQRKKQSSPLVSVVIPVYNTAAYLAEAIDSVLAQTHPVSEIIIVDDGSTDRSRDIALSYKEKVRYVYQHNQGIGAARNRGIEIAKGKYLAFLDADDRWTPGKIEAQLKRFNALPHLDFSFGNMIHFYSPHLSEEERKRFQAPAGKAPAYVAGTLLTKRDSFDRVGLFNPAYTVGEFIDWFMRCKKTPFTIDLLDMPLLERRVHGENTTLKKKSHQYQYLQIIRNSLQKAAAT